MSRSPTTVPRCGCRLQDVSDIPKVQQTASAATPAGLAEERFRPRGRVPAGSRRGVRDARQGDGRRHRERQRHQRCDRRSGGEDGTEAGDFFLDGVAKSPGANNAFRSTDVRAFNPGSAPAGVTINTMGLAASPAPLMWTGGSHRPILWRYVKHWPFNRIGRLSKTRHRAVLVWRAVSPGTTFLERAFSTRTAAPYSTRSPMDHPSVVSARGPASADWLFSKTRGGAVENAPLNPAAGGALSSS